MAKQEDINSVIQNLADDNDGKVTPEMVFDHAKDPDSPIHDEYEWDQEKAAYRDWMNTGRRLIRSVKFKVVRKTTTIECPVFTRDPDVPAKQQGYVDLQSAKSSEDTMREILVNEFIRARQLFDRAGAVAAYFELEDTLEDLKKRVDNVLESFQIEGRA